jgi:hypothetical protein
MLKQATNIIVQTVLSTAIGSLKPLNVVCKTTLELTAVAQSGMHVAKDATRRKLMPSLPINQEIEPLTFTDAYQDIHNIRHSEMHYLDKRISLAQFCKYNDIKPVGDIFAKFKKAPVAPQPAA